MVSELGADLAEFAAAEAPLLEDGWTNDTLLKLILHEYRSPEEGQRIECVYCRARPLCLDNGWEPWWDQHVERIRSGRDPHADPNEDEIGTRRRWERYAYLYKAHHICYFCQVKFEREASADIEDVPGLIKFEL